MSVVFLSFSFLLLTASSAVGNSYFVFTQVSPQRFTESFFMQVDQTSEKRTLKRWKEKVPKHLNRGANEKDMDSFTKRVTRIPLDKLTLPKSCGCSSERRSKLNMKYLRC